MGSESLLTRADFICDAGQECDRLLLAKAIAPSAVQVFRQQASSLPPALAPLANPTSQQCSDEDLRAHVVYHTLMWKGSVVTQTAVARVQMASISQHPAWPAWRAVKAEAHGAQNFGALWNLIVRENLIDSRGWGHMAVPKGSCRQHRAYIKPDPATISAHPAQVQALTEFGITLEAYSRNYIEPAYNKNKRDAVGAG